MFKNKIVLVTGSSSGIGRETAILFAQNGADVIVTYKSNKKGANEVVNEILKTGRKSIAIKADLTKENDAKNLVGKAKKMFGRIDILINNAGRYIDGDEWNGDSDIWIKSLKQNIVSVMSVSKYVANIFEKQKSGIMVNVASKHATRGHADAISYGASKAGVVNITQSYSKLLAQFGGRANSVSPSAVNVGYWLSAPKEEIESLESKLIDPSIVAKKILFLASDEAKDINGENFIIE